MTSAYPDHFLPRAHERGFSMIEVLVTLLIISLALLGTAGLQAYSMRLNQGSQFRTQAVFLAADLAERIEANKVGALSAGTPGPYDMAWDYSASGAYDTNSLPTKDCRTNTCNAGELATFDIWQWQNAVGDPNVLPQGSWSVVYTPTSASVGAYTITIGWVDRLSEKGNPGAAGAGYATYNASSGVGLNSGGTGERFFYTSTRAIHN